MLQPCDLVLIPFPYTDLSATKKRPVLVLKSSNDQGDFLAVQVTSQAGYGDAVMLSSVDLVSGLLPKQSYVRTSKLMTLNQVLVVAHVGKVSTAAFSSIHQAICHQIACVPCEGLNHV